MLSAENYPTLDKVAPVIVKLQRAVDCQAEDATVVKKMKTEMSRQMDFRMDITERVLASLLNPSTKELHFLSDEKKSEAHSSLQQKAAELAEKVVTAAATHTTIKQEPADDAPDLPNLPTDNDTGSDVEVTQMAAPLTPVIATAEPVDKKMKLDNWLDDIIYVSTTLPLSPGDQARQEVARYIATAANTGTSPLDWWKTNENNFPLISRLAKKYLCVPASSVPSERVFSLTGSIINKTRSQITPEYLDLFVFLNKNRCYWKVT